MLASMAAETTGSEGRPVPPRPASRRRLLLLLLLPLLPLLVQGCPGDRARSSAFVSERTSVCGRLLSLFLLVLLRRAPLAALAC